MNYNKKTDFFKSSNSKDNIKYFIYEPLSEIKAILQISHGMCEHIERYEHFADVLCENGILLCGHNHLGHKDSSSDENLGYFGHKNGYKVLVSDVKKLFDIVKEKYPNTDYFIMGHSMGSFILRHFLATYPDIDLDGAIICGTSGKNTASSFGIVLSKLISLIKGRKYRSKFLTFLAFSSYTKNIKDLKTPHDWLTRDDKIVDIYRKDKYCMFTFTADGYKDLMTLLTKISKKSHVKSFNKNLPIFVIGGDADPVGNYGKGTLEVYNRIKANGNKVFLKLYNGARHELINETNKDEVFKDIIKFINTKEF